MPTPRCGGYGLELLAGFALLGLVAAMGVQMPPASM
jgi:hypothetical protein